jgi:hypothetical protein
MTCACGADLVTDCGFVAGYFDAEQVGCLRGEPGDDRERHAPERLTRRTSFTARELLTVDLPLTRFAVEGLLPEGLTLLCGSPKIGKSWLGLGLGIAVAAGGYALGTIEVEKGEVLYLALEDNPRRLQSRLRVLLTEEPAPHGLYMETEWPRLDAGGSEQLRGWLDRHPAARLVIVDVYSRVRPVAGNRDKYQADYDAAALLQQVALSQGVAILALHHTRKAEAADFVETVSGTFGTAGAADTIIVIKRARGQADATLHVTGRHVQERELALKFAPEAGTWVLLGGAAEYAIGETRKQILDAVHAHGELTPKQLSAVTTVGHELAKKTMQRMATDGQLVAKRGGYIAPPEPAKAGTEGQEGRPPGECHAPTSPPDTPVPAVPASPRATGEPGKEGHGGQPPQGAPARPTETSAVATASPAPASEAPVWRCPRCSKPPHHITSGVAYCSCGGWETLGVEDNVASLLEELRVETSS